MKESVHLHFAVIEGRRCASCDTVLRSRYTSYKIEESQEIVRLCGTCSNAVDSVLRARQVGEAK